MKCREPEELSPRFSMAVQECLAKLKGQGWWKSLPSKYIPFEV